ncbi:hypothetical protein ACWT_6641 [Actinoplanes sp. SE50]|uniref:hypothetical protein n=1 Tax=unclassified Actinoplanes TaxID=2626549 RepID=UPI00023EC88D|nr:MULTISPECIES: hypothetical protein [unclassified Actinoplanes]AEV87653.1 hypothetical protein ACPL_6771 [Actinoplanes sp. SE50/110]ATO86056.1 hypothetical protein ACWT_6641 [Actinoplanes sp. SE50]SLM03470.1 hypothetical protein ACSP50_6759 [Actinoplanes sp. SE50/110]
MARLAADQRQAGSVRDAVDLLVRRDGHAGAAEWLTPRAQDDDWESVVLLIEQVELSGQADAAAEWRLRAAERGHGEVARRLAESYTAAGDHVRAAAVLWPSATTDRRSAGKLLGVLAAAGDIDGLEKLHRTRVLLRLAYGVGELADFLASHGREAEAEDVEQYGIEPDGSTALKWQIPDDVLETFAAAAVGKAVAEQR